MQHVDNFPQLSLFIKNQHHRSFIRLRVPKINLASVRAIRNRRLLQDGTLRLSADLV